MKFRSRNKKIIRLASTIGHVCLIGQEWVDVPDHMEGDAYSKGCISEEMYDTIKETIKEESGDQDEIVGEAVSLELGMETEDGKRNAIIKDAIDEMIDEPKPSDFTARGMPNLSVLSERCGFTVAKVRMEPVWDYIQAERDAKEAE